MRSISTIAAATAHGAYINATVWTAKLSMFTCPSDNNNGKGNVQQGTGQPGTNNYRASIGTTTAVGWTNGNSPIQGAGYASCQPDPFNKNGGQPGCAYATGLFCYWISYGIADCTDGTSNTVAYSESLVGDSGAAINTHSNNSVTGVGGAAFMEWIDISHRAHHVDYPGPPGLLPGLCIGHERHQRQR